MMGMMAGAASMLAMSAVKAFDYSKPPPHPRFAPPPKRHKKAKGNSYGRSAQKYDPARLIVDRPSTIRKLQRWHRAGTISLPEPDQRALSRHAWYRNRKKETVL